MSGQINYIVISLLKSETDEVIDILSADEKYKVWLDWLVANRDNYGESFDDWKPFGKESIVNLFNSPKSRNNSFESQSIILERGSSSPKEIVKRFLDSDINVVFIDPSALFLRENKELLIRIIAKIAKGDDCLCCQIIHTLKCPYLKNTTNETLENIQEYFEDGAMHNIIHQEGAFWNFINSKRIPFNKPKPNKQNENLFQDKGHSSIPSISLH